MEKKEILNGMISFILGVVIMILPFIPYWLTSYPETTPQVYTLWQEIAIWILALPFLLAWFEASFKLGKQLWSKVKTRIPYFRDLDDPTN